MQKNCCSLKKIYKSYIIFDMPRVLDHYINIIPVLRHNMRAFKFDYGVSKRPITINSVNDLKKYMFLCFVNSIAPKSSMTIELKVILKA